MIFSYIFILMLVVFLVSMFMGMPLSFAMIFGSLVYFLGSGKDVFILINQMFTGIDIFTLMAIPFFILAGELMVYSGTGNKLLRLANIFVGRFRGGLAYVNVLASMLFGGCSGSALADVSGLGPLEIELMEEGGYDKDFSVAVTVTSALQGPIIPPSIPLVLIGAVTGVSIGRLLLGGAIPGILIGIAQCSIIFFIAKKRNYPLYNKKNSLKEYLTVVINSLPFLFMPIIILGGIITGVFTPTEASAVAVLYGFILTLIFKRKDIKLKDLYKIIKRSAMVSAALLLLSSASNVFSWILSVEKVPVLLTNYLTTVTDNVYILLFMMNIFLLVWGMFMDSLPAILIIGPVVFPIMVKFGVDPVHFGVVMALNLMIGLITPPYGQAIFTGTIISNLPMEKVIKEIIPFLLASIGILLLITYLPQIILFLPKLYFG
ncbi:TRAP transporter large permease subunit [Iocasia frigidifontis]|uniref:TRAP transporter large permease subunit n=1 Tax=Iocasia fonsfrigidae TaxID=2682810 RepID=A0A8A7KHR0_9FIRM|nr:TRAP transporter large permease [Iocasia fonsfrigidae]QTL99615.1 TRAP transporter large permease subunit [Iocasia fonsfrigidae]